MQRFQNRDKSLELCLLNETLEDSKLAQQAIIILDHLQGGVVLEGGIVPVVLLDRQGKYGDGTIFKLDSIKHYDNTDDEATFNQFRGYALAREMTNGIPVTIGVAFSGLDIPLKDQVYSVSRIYKERWDSQNKIRLNTEVYPVWEQLHRKVFDWCTDDGQNRILENRTVTAYLSAPSFLMERVASFTHPGQEVHFEP